MPRYHDAEKEILVPRDGKISAISDCLVNMSNSWSCTPLSDRQHPTKLAKYRYTTLHTGLAGRQRETNRQTDRADGTDIQCSGCMAGNCYWYLPLIIFTTLSAGLAGRQRETNRQTGLMEQTDRVQAGRELLLVPSSHNTTLSTGLAGRQRETNRQTDMADGTDRQTGSRLHGRELLLVPSFHNTTLSTGLAGRQRETNRQTGSILAGNSYWCLPFIILTSLQGS